MNSPVVHLSRRRSQKCRSMKGHFPFLTQLSGGWRGFPSLFPCWSLAFPVAGGGQHSGHKGKGQLPPESRAVSSSLPLGIQTHHFQLPNNLKFSPWIWRHSNLSLGIFLEDSAGYPQSQKRQGEHLSSFFPCMTWRWGSNEQVDLQKSPREIWMRNAKKKEKKRDSENRK